MKPRNYWILLSIPLMLVALSSNAYDSKNHAEAARESCCAALEGMDHAHLEMYQHCIEQILADRRDDVGMKGQEKSKRGIQHLKRFHRR